MDGAWWAGIVCLGVWRSAGVGTWEVVWVVLGGRRVLGWLLGWVLAWLVGWLFGGCWVGVECGFGCLGGCLGGWLRGCLVFAGWA